MGLFQNSNRSIEKEIEDHLSEKFGKRIKIHSSNSLGGGCISHASKIETNAGLFFLKWNAGGPSDMFLREAESLEELKKAAGEMLVIPEVIAAKEADEKPGFLVLEYLEPGSPGNGSDEILGRGLAAIHQFAGKEYGFYHDNYCGSTLQNNSWKDNWVEFFRDNRLNFLLGLIQQERPLPADEMKVYEQLLQKIPGLLPAESRPVLIHGDLWSGNYMHTRNGPALIDPASCYADREMEMGIMTMFGGFSQRFFNAYNELNPLPAGWMERNKLYQLYHVLNHYYLFGGGYRSQALQIAKKFL
jgi:protein-ribulosamine 3-kinase